MGMGSSNRGGDKTGNVWAGTAVYLWSPAFYEPISRIMGSPVHCRLEAAHVREGKADVLTALIHQLFNRRHLSYVAAGGERAWLTAELVQSLRQQSAVYRAMSTKTEGPLPFALGYFRVREGRIEPISDTMPVEDPEVLARILSEFLEPGARLYIGTGAERQGWHIRDVDAVEPLSSTGQKS